MLSPIEIANATNEIVDQASALNVLEALKPILHNEIKAKTKAFTLSGTHHPSKDLLPIGFKSWTPINSTGNGNCLYNSISLILVGDETLAPMLRLLTKAELTAYSAYYADNPQLHAIALDGTYSFKSLIHIMISDDEANEIYDGNTNNIKSGNRTPCFPWRETVCLLKPISCHGSGISYWLPYFFCLS